MNENILVKNVNSINFVKRPMPVPYNYRIMYKIAQIVLIIGVCCKRGGCSLIKLHLVSYGLTSKSEMDNLSHFANSEKITSYPYIRFDPALNRGLSFAVSEGILEQQDNGKYKLTDTGKSFFKELENDSDLLVVEKVFLKSIAAKLPESKIEGLVADWRTYI